MTVFRVLSFLGLMLSHVSFVQAAGNDDTLLSGYATGVLNHEFKLDMPPLVVNDGVITLPVGSLNADPSIAPQPATLTSEAAELAPETVVLPTGFLPVGVLFKPFLADPRWAHFSVAYRNYQSNNFVGRLHYATGERLLSQCVNAHSAS